MKEVGIGGILCVVAIKLYGGLIMKKWFWVLGSIVVLAAAALAQSPGNAAPREVLVKFTSHVPAFVQELVREHDLDLVKGIGGTGAMRLRSRSRSTEALMRALSQRPDVEYVEPNYIVRRTATPSDPAWNSLWGMTKISAPAAWDETTGSQHIVVGVVDTGVDYNHPDLAGNIWSSTSSFAVTIGGVKITCPAGTKGFNAINNTCNPLDDEDHGTHVSGTIGAVANNGIGVAGVNWTTLIMGLKFLNAQGSGYTSDAVDAIEFAVQLKQQGVNIRVLNNSWGGGGYSTTLYNEIKRAGDNDILFVASAGNSGQNTDSKPAYPASYDLPNIIAVAATDNNDALASWSNYGAKSVDLGAPGVNILSTVRNNSYATWSGTSMAAPHVSGAAALVLSAGGCTSLTTLQLKNAILYNVDLVAGLSGKVLTGGRLKVDKAITNCTSAPPPPDFTLSVSPASANVKQGRSTNYTVKVSGNISFSGTVALSVSGCPTGASCTFSPGSVTGSGSSTLTVATGSSTPLGNYTLTITGVSGSLSHTATAALTVKR